MHHNYSSDVTFQNLFKQYIVTHFDVSINVYMAISAHLYSDVIDDLFMSL